MVCINLSLGVLVRGNPLFWLRGAEGDAEFSDNSDSSHIFRIGSELSDN